MVEDALHGWQRIMDLGYLPRICSSPIRSNPHSKREKLGWLEEHFVPVFGMFVVDQAIITRDKHLFDGRALIDDRPEVHGAATAPWRHIIFDQPYNQQSQGPRLFGWRDAKLPDLLKD